MQRYLDHPHVLGKKVIIFPSFGAGASGQFAAYRCLCKTVLNSHMKKIIIIIAIIFQLNGT